MSFACGALSRLMNMFVEHSQIFLSSFSVIKVLYVSTKQKKTKNENHVMNLKNKDDAFAYWSRVLANLPLTKKSAVDWTRESCFSRQDTHSI